MFIYNNIDSTLTNIPLQSTLVDIYKLSDNQFLAVTISEYNLLFTKYDECQVLI